MGFEFTHINTGRLPREEAEGEQHQVHISKKIRVRYQGNN